MEERIRRLESHLPDRLDEEDWEALAVIIERLAPDRYRTLPLGREARQAALLRILDEIIEELGEVDVPRRATPSEEDGNEAEKER